MGFKKTPLKIIPLSSGHENIQFLYRSLSKSYLEDKTNKNLCLLNNSTRLLTLNSQIQINFCCDFGKFTDQHEAMKK